ncbi:hypothetical protein SUNI508_11258 [Seiridium unicorne]|uniref:Uncharacterized protein n=1 Tax=Seiridium unicorne TaxID=138068 RepID=A0ABR2UJ64_9PEZI
MLLRKLLLHRASAGLRGQLNHGLTAHVSLLTDEEMNPLFSRLDMNTYTHPNPIDQALSDWQLATLTELFTTGKVPCPETSMLTADGGEGQAARTPANPPLPYRVSLQLERPVSALAGSVQGRQAPSWRLRISPPAEFQAWP